MTFRLLGCSCTRLLQCRPADSIISESLQTPVEQKPFKEYFGSAQLCVENTIVKMRLIKCEQSSGRGALGAVVLLACVEAGIRPTSQFICAL